MYYIDVLYIYTHTHMYIYIYDICIHTYIYVKHMSFICIPAKVAAFGAAAWLGCLRVSGEKLPTDQ